MVYLKNDSDCAMEQSEQKKKKEKGIQGMRLPEFSLFSWWIGKWVGATKGDKNLSGSMLCSNVIGGFEVFKRGSERGNEFALSDERNWGIFQPECFILGFWSWGQCFVVERVWRGERDNAGRLVTVLYTWSANWFLWDPVSDIKVSVWIEKLTKIFHPDRPPNRVIRNWGIFEWWVTKIEWWVMKKINQTGP